MDPNEGELEQSSGIQIHWMKSIVLSKIKKLTGHAIFQKDSETLTIWNTTCDINLF